LQPSAVEALPGFYVQLVDLARGEVEQQRR